jgi:hypothetical protein
VFTVQVIWVDLLSRQEFEAGFGSHTPIFSGQTKCVRYYMNFERGLALFKEIVAEVRWHLYYSSSPRFPKRRPLSLHSAWRLISYVFRRCLSMHQNIYTLHCKWFCVFIEQQSQVRNSSLRTAESILPMPTRRAYQA